MESFKVETQFNIESTLKLIFGSNYKYNLMSFLEIDGILSAC
jgi:hypothetical protein